MLRKLMDLFGLGTPPPSYEDWCRLTGREEPDLQEENARLKCKECFSTYLPTNDNKSNTCPNCKAYEEWHKKRCR